MKIINKISKNITSLINNALPNKTKDDLIIINYGLELFFTSIYKIIIIIAIAIYLDTLTFTIYMFIIFGSIRTFSAGAHARNWFFCTLSSIVVFNIIPIILTKILITNSIKLILFILSFLILLKYSPADTINRPIKNKKKRKILKILSLFIMVIFYFILSIKINNIYFSNLLCIATFTASLMTTPIFYKLFNNSYSTKK